MAEQMNGSNKEVQDRLSMSEEAKKAQGAKEGGEAPQKKRITAVFRPQNSANNNNNKK